jgi:diguanylate cyclase (GGDEF)-like protein/PAS domain S-box-containing protein
MGPQDDPARRELAISRSDFVLESTTDSVIVLDREWRILYRNKQALELLRGRDLRLGVSLWDAFPEALGGPFHQNYKRALEHQTPVEFEEYLESMEIWFEVHAYPSPNAISLFFRDVTERRRIREQLTYLAQHDFLTGLENRPHFRARLEQALLTAGSRRLVGLLYVDLDRFKEVNDALGHCSGDALLKGVAERLKSCIGDSDVTARIGGDEFVIVRSNLQSANDAQALAEDIIAAISTPFKIDGYQVGIGASIGIAIAPRDGTSADELLANADVALYAAKNDRGGYRFFEQEMAQFVRLRQALKADLADALGSGEFELEYQPIYGVQSGRIVTFEALLRWRHAEHGTVMPAEFIPLAEETGLIASIGEWALETACAEATNWPQDIGLAVNLSPVQVRSSLPFRVAGILNKTGLRPSRLLLEMTESVFFLSSADNVELFEQLRTLGVKLALDDFGTGYSSLGYLREFPVDEIKIDRSFVQDTSAEALAIIDSVAKLGHALGAHVTAEGIETQRQYERIREIGCDKAQGFLLGRPVASHEASEQVRVQCKQSTPQSRTKLPNRERSRTSDWAASR